MSDFLSKLIMRSREPAEAIKPRLSSRYEGPVVSDAPAAHAIQEGPDESFTSDEIRLARSMRTISPARAEFVSHDDSPPTVQSPRSPKADTPRTTGIRDFDTRQSEKQAPVALPVAPQIIKLPFVATDREQNEHTPQKSPEPDSGRSAPKTHVQEQAATRDSVPSPQPRTQTAEPPETRRPRIEVSPNIIAQPQIAPYAEPKALPIQQAAAVTEPQPVINVTIGRVEVRATTSQPRVRQSGRAQSPVMSLDEYLRQRKEGER